MTTTTTTTTTTIDSQWKERIERALKHVCRTVDLRQRRDAIPLLNNFAEQVERISQTRRPKFLANFHIENEKKPSLYQTSSIDEMTDENLHCSVTILPQVDPLPNMFTYVSLQRNFLCDTVTNLSDLLLDEDDEDVQLLLNSVQSEGFSTSKRIRRSSKSSTLNDRNNEMIFDDEHFIELLKRLKQQHSPTSDDELNLFEILIKIFPSSADLIREHFGTIFETKRILTKEFTPNIDHPTFASDTSIEKTLHSYFMLFCRRCHRYDCFLHRDKQAIPDCQVRSRSKSSDLIYRPCGKFCFRLKSSRRTKIEFKRSFSEMSETNLNGNLCSTKRVKCQIYSNEFAGGGGNLKRKSTDEWSASDKSLFRVFYTIYSDNICMIADLLEKSCSQVYQFYLNEYGETLNEFNSIFQRQISANSSSTISDPNEMKTNGNGKSTHHSEDSIEEEKLPSCNGRSRRSHFSSFRRQRSHQQLLLNHHHQLNSEKKRHTYYPCDHERSKPCNEHCFCVRSGNFCEKFCVCSSNKCENRFPGCRCRSSCTTKQCPCYAAGRECDPDLCTQCGADDFRSFHQDLKLNKGQCSCHNVALQRSLHKPLLLAESDVAGWGIFTQVNIQRNEFIAEYCGEILTQDEGELRGRMYDTIGTSFLFDLNEEYMVDATRRGNKIRFANHSINPNCYAKVILVNGDHRIGIYSKRFISAGEELFFDYRYGANHHLRFVGVEKPTGQDPIDPL